MRTTRTALAIALFVGGCTEGGTLPIPVGFCQEDIDCAPGFTCEHKGFDGTGMCDRRTPEVVCPTPGDAGMPDAGFDAGFDAGETLDSGNVPDAGETPDSGEVVDAGSDAGALDASDSDAGNVPDASSEDAGEIVDAGHVPDSGNVPDAGETPDSGEVVDAGSDAGVVVERLRIDNFTLLEIAQGVFIISGDTNREATSVFTVTNLAPKSETRFKFNHSFTLAILASGQYTYHLVVTDRMGETVSVTSSFDVGVVPDTTKPTIFVGVKPAGQHALVVDWLATEELVDPVVHYGVDAQHLTYTKGGTPNTSSGTISLTGLNPDTSYTVKIKGRDKAVPANLGESNLA